MKFILATRNNHKIAELQSILRGYIRDIEILSLDDIGFSGEIEENGTSFEENALIKAQIPAKLGYIGIADDSGLCVRELDGAPGIFSARFAGEHGNDAANNRLLLEKLSDTADRSAEFVCAVACVFPDGRKISVTGRAAGEIILKESGFGGFGYDPLFYSHEAKKTFAELSAEEKNKISHRAKAIELFAEELKGILGESE